MNPKERRFVSNIAEDHAFVVSQMAVPNAMPWEVIKTESSKCPELSEVKRALQTGNWDSCSVSYRANQKEFCEFDSAILRGNRLVMPVSLRDRVIELARRPFGHRFDKEKTEVKGLVSGNG